MSKIPSEISDIVIDYLHSDRDALAACALVCKEWLPGSRYHLFYTIWVNEQNFQQFLDTLNTPRCFWRRHVRHLHMTGIRRYTISWLCDANLAKLSTLEAVDQLSLRNLDGYDDTQVARLSATLPGVKELRISHCHFQSLPHCMCMITPFSLKRLTLEENTYHNVTLTEPPIEWMHNPNVIHLRSLLHREICVIGKFLQFLGPSITHLYLARPHFLRRYCSDGTSVCATQSLPTNQYAGMYYAINLAHNTNLRCLHFGRIKLNELSGSHWKAPLVWMEMVLSQITSSQMEELRFWIEVDFYHDLNRIDWDMLARLFAQPCFSGLKILHFDVQRFGYVNVNSAGEWIRHQLLACDARGILTIYDMPPVRFQESRLGG